MTQKKNNNLAELAQSKYLELGPALPFSELDPDHCADIYNTLQHNGVKSPTGYVAGSVMVELAVRLGSEPRIRASRQGAEMINLCISNAAQALGQTINAPYNGHQYRSRLLDASLPFYRAWATNQPVGVEDLAQGQTAFTEIGRDYVTMSESRTLPTVDGLSTLVAMLLNRSDYIRPEHQVARFLGLASTARQTAGGYSNFSPIHHITILKHRNNRLHTWSPPTGVQLRYSEGRRQRAGEVEIVELPVLIGEARSMPEVLAQTIDDPTYAMKLSRRLCAMVGLAVPQEDGVAPAE